MKTLFNKFIDVVCFILGPFILVINIVNFENDDLLYGAIYYYHYSQSTRLAIGLGVALIAFGLLRIYWRRNKN